MDITNLDTIEPFSNNLPNEFKDIDIFVNNVEKALGSGMVGDISMNDVKGIVDTNLIGLINITQAVLKIFKKNNSGDVVNIGSVARIESYPTRSIYCVTKFAVRAFTKSLRKELINTNIRVILIAPRILETEFYMMRYKGDIERARHIYDRTMSLSVENIADVIVNATSRRQNTVIDDNLVFSNCKTSSRDIFR